MWKAECCGCVCVWVEEEAEKFEGRQRRNMGGDRGSKERLPCDQREV